jgi:hypothetical protein
MNKVIPMLIVLFSRAFAANFELSDLLDSYLITLNYKYGKGEDAVTIYQANTFQIFDEFGETYMKFFFTYYIGKTIKNGSTNVDFPISPDNIGTISVRVSLFFYFRQIDFHTN